MVLSQDSTTFITSRRNEFSKFIVETAKAGYGRTRKQIKKIAEDVAHDKGVLDDVKSVSDGWYHDFMKTATLISFLWKEIR